MDEQEIKAICAAAMLLCDDGARDSLRSMETRTAALDSAPRPTEEDEPIFPLTESRLREDIARQIFTRDEMLSNSGRREGEYVVVPQVIQ